MDTNIASKFVIATEQGIATLSMLTNKIAIEKFSELVTTDVLENYLQENFNEKTLTAELNSMANQWLAVFVGDEPAGYARLTSKGKKPEFLDGKRALRIADFGILKKYSDLAIRQSLFDKCMAVCRSYETVWINEHVENTFIEFFETEGFIKQDGSYYLDQLTLPSACLIKKQ